MSTPFDTALEQRRGQPSPSSLEDVRRRVNQLTSACQPRPEEWRKHNKALHEQLMREALEEEAQKVQHLTMAEKKQLEKAENKSFQYVQHRDELLGLSQPEAYLAGRRALSRREREVQVHQRFAEIRAQKENPPTEPSQAPGPIITGRRIWGAFTAVGTLVAYGNCLATSWWTVLLTPAFLLIWAAITRLPLIYVGTFDGGSPGRASGSAV